MRSKLHTLQITHRRARKDDMQSQFVGKASGQAGALHQLFVPSSEGQVRALEQAATAALTSP